MQEQVQAQVRAQRGWERKRGRDHYRHKCGIITGEGVTRVRFYKENSHIKIQTLNHAYYTKKLKISGRTQSFIGMKI